MRRLWNEQKPLVLGFAAALCVVGYFGVQTARHALYWSDPENIHRPPEAWMTLGYLARSWHVDKHQLGTLLELEQDEGKGKSLRDIARAKGVPLEEIIDQLSHNLPVLTALPKDALAEPKAPEAAATPEPAKPEPTKPEGTQ